MDKSDIALFIAKLIFWLIGLLSIYWLILKLTDHSPAMIALMLILQSATFACVIVIIIFLFRFSNRVSADLAQIKQRNKESDRRFFALAKDFQDCKKKTCST